MSAKEIVIGARRFARIEDAKQAVREVMYAAELGVPLTGEHLAFITDVVACHPTPEDKVGSGLASITVRMSRYKQRGFWITRTDGTVVDFSYQKCVEGAPTQRIAIHRALRLSVTPQINEFRAAYFRDEPEPRCAITDVRISMGQEAHVDHHEPTFVELADAFIAQHGSPDAFELIPAIDGIGRQLADKALESEWLVFHEANARLRVVSKLANLTRKRKASEE